jgi:four helix bundle protein
MQNLSKLLIWNKAIELSVSIYRITNNFPKTEMYGLQSQIRRSAVSIPSNISEGAGRNSKKEFIHFLGIASGSCFELETQLVSAQKLEYISLEEAEYSIFKIVEIQKMLFKLMEKLKSELN